MSSRAEPGLHRLLLKGLRRFRPPPAKGPHRVAGDTHPQMRPWLSAGKTAAGRFGIWTPPAPPHIPRGYLRLYAAAASSADQGAVLQPERLSRLP